MEVQRQYTCEQQILGKTLGENHHLLVSIQRHLVLHCWKENVRLCSDPARFILTILKARRSVIDINRLCSRTSLYQKWEASLEVAQFILVLQLSPGVLKPHHVCHAEIKCSAQIISLKFIRLSLCSVFAGIAFLIPRKQADHPFINPACFKIAHKYSRFRELLLAQKEMGQRDFPCGTQTVGRSAFCTKKNSWCVSEIVFHG